MLRDGFVTFFDRILRVAIASTDFVDLTLNTLDCFTLTTNLMSVVLFQLMREHKPDLNFHISFHPWRSLEFGDVSTVVPSTKANCKSSATLEIETVALLDISRF